MTDDDRELSEQFKAEAARILVPARARRRQGRSVWSVLAPAATGVAVVLLALALGRGLLDFRSPAVPTASATPNHAAGAASPSPTTSAAASPTPEASPFGPDPRYGIVMVPAEGGSVVIRSETDARPIATLGSSVGGVVVSPDGRRLVFWTRSEAGSNSLQLWDAATPDRTTTLLTAPEGEVGGGIIWAPDSEGLLLSFFSLARPPGMGAQPDETVLRTLEVGSGELTEVARAERRTFVPVAWNRERQTVAAVEVRADGGFASAYVFIRDGQASRTSLSDGEVVAHNVVGSPDALWVLDGDRNVLWPIDDPERVTELRPEGECGSPLGWLPQSPTHLIMSAGGSGPQDRPLFLWDMATGDCIPAGSTRYDVIPRADGTALYVMDERGATSVVDIASGRVEPVPDMPVYLVQGQVFPEGRPIASVILR